MASLSAVLSTVGDCGGDSVRAGYVSGYVPIANASQPASRCRMQFILNNNNSESTVHV